MRLTTKNWVASLAVVAGVLFALAYFRAPLSVAQDAGRPDVGAIARRTFATKVVTLKFDKHRGDPREVSEDATFDRNVDVYWISVVGADVKFSGSTEKQINRKMFWVDPIAKVNGRRVEVTGKLGIRDGSGDWDDTYEGTITVAVTAIMADQ